MPDQSSAADEHAILQEITAPLATLPDDPVPIAANVDFPIVLRGYDRLAVDAYVKRTSQLVAELQATRSPEAAIRRAIDRMGEQISGILQRAHETAEQITTQSRAEAEDRLEVARHEALQIAAAGEQRLKDLDADTDRIWAERLRIVEDARELAGQLLALAESAAERFPPAEAEAGVPVEAEMPVEAVMPVEEGEYEPQAGIEPEGGADPDSFDHQAGDPDAADYEAVDHAAADHEAAAADHEAGADPEAAAADHEDAADPEATAQLDAPYDQDATAVLPPVWPAQDVLPLGDEPPAPQ